MKKLLLLLLLVLPLGLILKFKDSDIASEEKSNVVFDKLVKADLKEPLDAQIRKAHLGLSSIYANKNPEKFIASSDTNLKIILTGLQSDHHLLAKEIAEKILSPNSELRIKNEKARQVFVSCKRKIAEALQHTTFKI